MTNTGWSADIATFSWVYCSPFAGLSLDSYPNLTAWVSKIKDREAVMEGLDIPEPNSLKATWSDPEKLKELISEGQSKMASSNEG